MTCLVQKQSKITEYKQDIQSNFTNNANVLKLAKISQQIAKRSSKTNRSLPFKDLVCTHIEIVKLNKKKTNNNYKKQNMFQCKVIILNSVKFKSEVRSLRKFLSIVGLFV